MTTTPAAAAPDFTALLDELAGVTTTNETLAKALDADAEFEAGEDGKPKLGADGKPVRRAPPAADEGEMMGKSFQVTLPTGENADAIDATDILKALDGDMGLVRRALPQLVGALKAQGDMIKALGTEIAGLRSQGTGRRSALTVADRPAVTEARSAAAEGMQPGDFMAKAMDCVRDGVLTSMDASMLDAQMARGLQPDPSIVSRVMSHKPR